MAHKILLVDDDRENLSINKALLAKAGYQVSLAASGAEAIKAVSMSRRDFSLILMDYHMPGMSGVEAIKTIKSLRPNQQILAFSLDDTREVMRENFRAGAVDFLDKNVENEQLLAEISSYCAKYDRLYRPVSEEGLEPGDCEAFIQESGMIGKSEKLFELCRQIRKIAPTAATTLVLGESGTGKELVAQALHDLSDRAKSPFIPVNIAAEPASLLDSSLFGHKKGAFTGATSDQPGKFMQANKGTIFLDEIGDMTLDLQVKLLRVIQEREITPLGGVRPMPVDVRIIAATHRDLQKMVAEGTFREDLYYRLSTIILTATPLRERIEDIEPLVVHFTRLVCKENGFQRSFHRSCLDVLRVYPWKGNVRELRSIVERHLVAADSDTVKAEDLEAKLYQKHESSSPKTMDEIDEHIDGIKKKLVLEAVKNSMSNAEAARKLDIPPNRLHYFLTKWNLGGLS